MMTAPISKERYLACLDADFVRFRAALADTDLSAPVPTCPDWTGAGLARHLANVYLHKVECMKQGCEPDPWPPRGATEEEALHQLDRGFTALRRELSERDPGQRSFTWFTPDQSVGFWLRRMALETAIHRIDAELTAGLPPAPVAADLAEDGVAEFLMLVEFGVTTWPDDFAEALRDADGRTVRLCVDDSNGSEWFIRPTQETIEITSANDVVVPADLFDDAPHVFDAETIAAEATISGSADALCRWLWNRADDDEILVVGDPALAVYVSRLFAIAAQ